MLTAGLYRNSQHKAAESYTGKVSTLIFFVKCLRSKLEVITVFAICHHYFTRITPPGCTWAQRPKHIILTVGLTDVKDPTIKLEKNKMYFKGVGGTEMKPHEVEMEFFKEVDVEVSFICF